MAEAMVSLPTPSSRLTTVTHKCGAVRDLTKTDAWESTPLTGATSGSFRRWTRDRGIRATHLWASSLAVIFLLIPLSLFAPRPVVVNLEGSTTIGLDMMPTLVDAHFRNRKAHGISTRDGDEPREKIVTGTFPGDWQPTRFVIRARGTHTAFDDRDTDVDIGMASEQISFEEADRLAIVVSASGAGENVIGVDGVAVVAHPDLRLPALSTGDSATCSRAERRTGRT